MTDDQTPAPMPITDPALIPLPRRYADLLAAARAAVAAEDEGEPDPLWYVRDELDAQDTNVRDER